MTEPDRAERALQAMLAQLDPPEPPDPRVAQRRVHGRRVALTAVAAALVVVALVGGAVALRPPDVTTAGGAASGGGGGGGSSADTLPRDPVPKGWRTEYYRTVSFQVPDSWGYAYEPGGDWCAASPDGKPDAAHRSPYVALGKPTVEAAIGCTTDPPATLTTEHAQVTTLSPAANYLPYQEVRLAGWWRVTSVSEVVLTVTSRDRALARRIAKSVVTAPATAPCDPASPAARKSTGRPADPFDVATVTDPGAMVVCQYDGPDHPGGAGLRAVVRLDSAQASGVLDRIREAPVRAAVPCEGPTGPDLRLVIRFETGGLSRELYVRAGDCRTGTDGWGGFDDGTNVRALTRASCQAVLQPPARLDAAAGLVGRACLG